MEKKYFFFLNIWSSAVELRLVGFIDQKKSMLIR